MQPFDQARVRCHHALALAHEVVSKCLKGLTNFRAKWAAIKEGVIPIDPVSHAIIYVDETFARRITELSYLALDDKSLATFAAVAPVSSANEDSMQQPPAKKPKVKAAPVAAAGSTAKVHVRGLTENQRRESLNVGYLWKLTSRGNRSTEWDAAVAAWPCAHLCLRHALRSFSCPYGADGKQQGQCPSEHIDWKLLNTRDKQAISEWQRRHTKEVAFL